MGDVGDPAAEAGGGDAVPQGLLGDPHQLGDVGGTSPTRDGDRRVAVPAVDDRAAVDRDDVAVVQHPVARDAVDDLVVHRRADGRRERRVAVALEGRDGAGGPDAGPRRCASSSPVVTPAPGGLTEQLERAADDQAGPPHRLDLLGRLDLDAAFAERHVSPRQLWGTTSSASKIRLRHLVDVTHAVDLDQDAALAVDLDQRLGLLGVDLLATPDDLLGVVGAPVGLGPLQQPLHELLGVDGQDHGRVEAVAGERDHPVELLDLGQGPRVAVEQESGLGVGLVRSGRGPSGW